MRFNSFEFLIFLAVVLALAPLFRGRSRHVLLLLPSSILFRGESLEEIRTMFVRMFTLAPGQGVAGQWYAILGLLLGVHALCFWRYREDLLQRLSWPGRILLVSGAVAAIAMLSATGRPFLYFQF